MAMGAVGRMKFFEAIYLVVSKRSSRDAFVSGLSALGAWTFGKVGFGRLDDIRGGRLGGVGGVFREPGDLLGQLGDLLGESVDLRQQLGVLPAQSSVFCFQFRDASQIGLFSGRFHRPLPVVLLVVSSATCGLGLSGAEVLGRRHEGGLGTN